VIIDGAADEPCSALGQKTPLEAAKTPNLDFLAGKSRIDYCYSVKEGVAPESSSAVVSLLGYDPNFAPRGPLEAKGIGIKLKNGDLAFRCNFGTIDNLDNLNVLDRRAGRTLSTSEARELAKAINEKVKLQFKFEFYPSIQHRGVLVIRGGFSDNISNADPGYSGRGALHSFGGEKLEFSKPLDEEDDSKLAAELVNSFVRQSYEVLSMHPVNIARIKKGLFAANVIFCRDAGSTPIKFKKLQGKWMALAYMPLEIGIAELAGMTTYKFKYPKMRGIDVYGNLYDGLNDAITYAKRMLWWYKNKYDYFYIHFKETDIPGHDNNPCDKVKMIELLDKRFFSYLKDFIGRARLVVTADHTTSCRQKAHTAAPVPVMTYPQEKESRRRFIESDAAKGKKIMGRNLLKNYFFEK
jgi:2,3-bisphosphoglycerate-independent phosphoglycerate mutase